MVTDINELDFSKKYSYADYLTWWFDERVELIKGYIKKMSPAPSNTHQKVIGNLHLEIGKFLKKKKCQIRIAPFDVRLTRTVNDKESFTVVQPDICVICNPEILDERGCNGVPDLIIEILSLSSKKHDLVTKYQLYQEVGVHEYWVAYPNEKMIEVFLLENNKYTLKGKFFEDDKLSVYTLPGLTIDLSEVFEE
ncbi:MAG: Uma2 family endonuclease [Bacteroidota bacterium]|nr:Uma2 family endonuclease [Bacteroidota bacterium]